MNSLWRYIFSRDKISVAFDQCPYTNMYTEVPALTTGVIEMFQTEQCML